MLRSGLCLAGGGPRSVGAGARSGGSRGGAGSAAGSPLVLLGALSVGLDVEGDKEEQVGGQDQVAVGCGVLGAVAGALVG